MSESIVNKSPSCYQQERLIISGLVNHFKHKMSISQTAFYFHTQK